MSNFKVHDLRQSDSLGLCAIFLPCWSMSVWKVHGKCYSFHGGNQKRKSLSFVHWPVTGVPCRLGWKAFILDMPYIQHRGLERQNTPLHTHPSLWARCPHAPLECCYWQGASLIMCSLLQPGMEEAGCEVNSRLGSPGLQAPQAPTLH